MRYAETPASSVPAAQRAMVATIVDRFGPSLLGTTPRIRWAVPTSRAAGAIPGQIAAVTGWVPRGLHDGTRWVGEPTVYLVSHRADARTLLHELRHLVQLDGGWWHRYRGRIDHELDAERWAERQLVARPELDTWRASMPFGYAALAGVSA